MAFINIPQPTKAQNPQQQQQAARNKRMKTLLGKTLTAFNPGMSAYLPLVNSILPEADTIYDVAQQLLNQRGPVWDEMQTHLKAIVSEYEAD